TEDAIIEYNQNYIYIHRDGKILSQKKNITNEDIPLIKEVNLQECIVGEYIKLKNKSDKNMLLELLKSLINNNLIRDIYNIELKKEYVIMKNKDDIDIVLNLDD
ncbi:MAG: hypothetical protein ACRCXT_21640, partial [Paraclostridium sp.]